MYLRIVFRWMIIASWSGAWWPFSITQMQPFWYLTCRSHDAAAYQKSRVAVFLKILVHQGNWDRFIVKWAEMHYLHALVNRIPTFLLGQLFWPPAFPYPALVHDVNNIRVENAGQPVTYGDNGTGLADRPYCLQNLRFCQWMWKDSPRKGTKHSTKLVHRVLCVIRRLY